MPDHPNEIESLRPLLQALPGTAYLLDKTGQVLEQNTVDLALRKRLPADSRGQNFFVGVIAGGGTPELGGAFYAAMADAQASLDVDLDWRLSSQGGQDVRIRLRKVAATTTGDVLGLAIVEDATRQKTTERALSAAMGEGRDEHMHDPVTRMFSRAQFDFLVPIELRRAQRYGYQTSLLAVDLLPGALSDDALRAATACTISCLRQSDFCFRFSGSRFYVLLTHTDAAGAEIAGQRIGISLHKLLGQPNSVLGMNHASTTYALAVGQTNFLQASLNLLKEVERKLALVAK